MTYSEFSYQNLVLDRQTLCAGKILKISVDVTNIGTVTATATATDIVQCYISRQTSTTTRPERELKDFVRVSLNPDETQTVSFTFDQGKLSFYGINNCFALEPGIVDILVGGNSNCHLKSSFEVTV